MPEVRRILAVGHDNCGSRLLFERLLAYFPDVNFGLAITEGIYYRKSGLQSVLKLLRESSILFCGVRALDMLLYRLKGNTLARLIKTLPLMCSFRTRDINDARSIQKIKQFEPDLIVSLYTMHIYREPTLALARLGGITSHPSILPNYRGLEVFFWAMVNQEKTIGVSVFSLSGAIDSGKVLNEVELPLGADQSMASVYKMITEKAAELLVKSIFDIRDDKVTYRIPEGQGSYYPMPTRTAVRKFRQLRKRFF
jgi:methionyl-tRNA formyltransferase